MMFLSPPFRKGGFQEVIEKSPLTPPLVNLPLPISGAAGHRGCGTHVNSILPFNDVVSPDEIEKKWRDFGFEDRMAGRTVGWVERSRRRWVSLTL